MHNLTEVDQAVLVSIAAGFVSGLLHNVMHKMQKLIVKNKDITLKKTIVECIFLGCTMAIILGVLTFTLISVTYIPIKEIVQVIVIIAISFGIVGLITEKQFEILYSKIFSKPQND
jgi:Asp/Glu/hydantoin racemase